MSKGCGDSRAYGLSIITILWWVSIWYLIEEGIEYIAGNKRHLKAITCIVIIISISIYCSIYQNHGLLI